ncbi:hypothetical protein LUW75_08765 [Streptomyces sp. MRC013]|uniref:hypothetical protein n=1 Tax=Streptomyces sp. MRC013 TaxID=2898276 RepID=UPI002026AFCF|nr:hypothetical protein [Streptomyces sp. MRC013]URM90063.1 hypothetical protein LUW75_08765 [Streptomyces sp. MRC013]
MSLVLTTLAGCGANESDDLPFAGTAPSFAAADEAEKASSETCDPIGVKGKASETGPGVTGCSGRDGEEFFQTFHRAPSPRPHPGSSTVW